MFIVELSFLNHISRIDTVTERSHFTGFGRGIIDGKIGFGTRIAFPVCRFDKSHVFQAVHPFRRTFPDDIIINRQPGITGIKVCMKNQKQLLLIIGTGDLRRLVPRLIKRRQQH